MSIDILLVEDNEADVRLLREVLLATNKGARLHVVSDGRETMEFLRYQGPHLHAPRPSVILLDLNLPKMHGHEVLSLIKADPRLQTIPVIVLTSSQEELDVVTSYQLRANCYLRKPDKLQEFEQLVQSLNDLWLTRVKLPQQRQVVGPL